MLVDVRRFRAARVVAREWGWSGSAHGPSLDRSLVHSYCAAVKNITVSVDDELYHAARVAAAQKQTSVTAAVRGYLAAFASGKAPLMNEPDAKTERQDRDELVRLFREANLVLGYQPSRGKSYER
jgi:hypothetical protein